MVCALSASKTRDTTKTTETNQKLEQITKTQLIRTKIGKQQQKHKKRQTQNNQTQNKTNQTSSLDKKQNKNKVEGQVRWPEGNSVFRKKYTQ